MADTGFKEGDNRRHGFVKSSSKNFFCIFCHLSTHFVFGFSLSNSSKRKVGHTLQHNSVNVMKVF